MKKIITLLLLVINLSAFAQLNFIGSLNNYTQIGNVIIDGKCHFVTTNYDTLKLYDENLNIVNQIYLQPRVSSSYPYVIYAGKGAITLNGQISYIVVYGNIDYTVVIYDQSGNILHEQVDANSAYLTASSPPRLTFLGNGISWVYNIPGTVSINDIEPNKLQSLPFPNPSNNFINLPIITPIYDSKGVEVLKPSTNLVDISQLPTGLYLYKGGKFIKK